MALPLSKASQVSKARKRPSLQFLLSFPVGNEQKVNYYSLIVRRCLRHFYKKKVLVLLMQQQQPSSFNFQGQLSPLELTIKSWKKVQFCCAEARIFLVIYTTGLCNVLFFALHSGLETEKKTTLCLSIPNIPCSHPLEKEND